MKTLALVGVMLFGSSALAETPSYLKPPAYQVAKQVAKQAAYVGFVSFAAAFIPLGLAGMSKLHPGASPQEQKVGGNLVSAAFVCSGAALTTMATIKIAF